MAGNTRGKTGGTTRAPADTPTGVVDRQPLDDLCAGDEDAAELVASLVALYDRDGSQRIEMLHDAVRRGDGETVIAVVHSLKGASRTIGAVEVGALCELIERSGRMPKAAEVSRLDAAFRRALTVLRHFEVH